jgi:hypothetical protein
VTIASELDMPYSTVRRIWRRYRRKGEAGLIPDYHRYGRPRAARAGRWARAAGGPMAAPNELIPDRDATDREIGR